MTDQEYKDLARETLVELTTLLGYDCQCTLAPADNDHSVKVSLTMDDPGRIIGRKGQTLEALELLLNRIMARKQEENAPWIMLDVDGYTTGVTGERRPGGNGGSFLNDEETTRLQHIATDVAKEVRHWKKERRIGPYMPAERRIIHTALKESEGIETQSIPAPEAGPKMKYVVIKLKEE